MSKKNIFSIILSIILSLIIGFLIYKQIIYPTIIPMVIKGGASLFADWTVILNASDCYQKGYDVYLNNPCDYWNRKHVYGEILLSIPFIKTYPKFYYFYFPIIIGFLFIYILCYTLFDHKNIKFFIPSLIFIFSLPVLLAIERSNIDLIIFIFMFLIAKFNNYFLKYFLIVTSSVVKFYPILLSAIFLYEKNKKNLLINIILILFMIFIIMVFQYESLKKIFNNTQQFTGYGYGLYEFSFFGFFNFFQSLNINIDGKNFNWIKYIYATIFILIPFIVLNFFKILKFDEFIDSSNIEENLNFENKLYFLASTIIIFCYFSFSNFIYREIFFLGLVPSILMSLSKSESKVVLFYFYLLLSKFLLTSIFIYIYQNNIFELINPLMILIKHTVDLYLIFFVFNFYLKYISLFFRKFFLNFQI